VRPSQAAATGVGGSGDGAGGGNDRGSGMRRCRWSGRQRRQSRVAGRSPGAGGAGAQVDDVGRGAELGSDRDCAVYLR